MHRLLLLTAALAVAPALFAQDDAEKSVDLAIAFPATTMVYLRADTDDYFDALNPEEIFAGLDEAEMGLPDLGEIAKQRLELPLTDAEVKALASGITGTAGGLLDITVSGPKYQIVFEHDGLSALKRALVKAHEDKAVTVPGIEDYYGTDIYEIYLPAVVTETEQPNPWGGMAPSNPLDQWADLQDYWAAIIDGKYLVISTNENAVKDAVDYLSFPDDPVDTLLGNSRYKEAIADFIDPQAVYFVNVQSVISAMERLSGDQGSGGIFQMMFRQMLRSDGGDMQFLVDLVQYEQFKSFAAGLWIDEDSLTMRMDANLVFHNAPAWFDAIRIEPQEMPLTDFIPAHSMIAVTDCVGDVHGLYTKAQDFFVSRARNAGQDGLADAWLDFEKELADDTTSVNEALSHLGGRQALVVIPTDEDVGILEGNPIWTAGILGLKNLDQAREYFYEKLINSSLGEPLRGTEGTNTPVTMHHGVEIHHTETGEWGFAFMPGEGETGVFAVGQVEALKCIVDARHNESALSSLASWQDAKGLLWESGSLHAYVNLGSVIGTGISAGLVAVINPWAFSNWGKEDDHFDRDDTEKDDDPTDFLSYFFRNTVIVASSRSSERSVSIRVAAAGWPDSDQLRTMAVHFRDVERNKQVRDDYVRLRDAARAHFALQGAPAKTVSELTDAGLLADDAWAIDPFGADGESESQRQYALAEAPDDVDIRQAILLGYQAEQGLRGNHLAILWNSHVVELTPSQLARALELAKEGKPLPEEKGDDGHVWYAEAMRPVFELDDPRNKVAEVWWVEDNTVDVKVIDDNGDEELQQVDEDNVLEETEEILEQQDTANEDEE